MTEKMNKTGSGKVPIKDRIFNAGYGIGASIVIIGVLFKLMNWEGADLMLTVGLVAEAFIFFISAFERPLKTYEWDKVIDFEKGKIDFNIDTTGFFQQGQMFTAPNASPRDGSVQQMPVYQHVTTPVPTTGQITPVHIEGLSEEDAQRLSQSIQNLAKTASQLNDLAAISLDSEKYVNSIRSIAETTSQYASSQESLIQATNRLNDIYQRLGNDTEKIEINTREYGSRIEKINSNLAGMNSIYEIQLKDIHAQSVQLNNQTEISRKLGEEIRGVTSEVSKLRNVSDDFSIASQKLRVNANELADNIAKLNSIYGNMLNAMS